MAGMTTAPELTDVLFIGIHKRLATRPVAIYARLSKNPDGTKDSTETQLIGSHRAAEDRWPGRPTIDFVDDDLTAADDAVYRPGFEAMLAAIKAGQVGDVLCREQERISRHEEIWPRFKKVCVRAGITHLRTWLEGDLPLLDGESLGPDIVNLVNAHYVKTGRQKLNNALNERVRQGRPHGAQPYGYRIERDEDGRARLVQIPEQVTVVNDIIDRIFAGWSLAEIGRHLDATGVPTKKGGKHWDPTCIRGVVTNATAAGFVVKKGVVVGPGEWEPIIDAERWEKVKAILSRPRKITYADGTERIITGTKRPARSYLLGGYVFCGLCDIALVSGLYYGRKGQRVPYYFCRKTVGGCGGIAVNAEMTEAHVVADFLDFLDTKAFLRHLRKVDVDRPKREKLQAKIDAKETDRAKAGVAFAKGTISLTALEAVEFTIDGDVVELRRQLAELAPVPFETDPAIIRAGFMDLGLGEQRRMLDDYGCSVSVASAVKGRRFDSGRLSVSFGGQ